MRDVFKGVETAQKDITPRNDIATSEIQELFSKYQSRVSDTDALYHLIAHSFYFGYSVGLRAGKRERAKGSRCKQ